MKHIARIYKSIFKWMPFSATYTALDYLYGAFVPAIITLVSANLFDSAASLIRGDSVQSSLYYYGILYLVVYLIGDFSNYFRSITLNAGIYEKGTAHFRINLYEKMAKLPLIMFEDSSVLDKKERAEKAVNQETLSATFNHTMRFVRAGISVVSIAVVLTRYSIWLLPLSLLSVLPYLYARVIRGKEFYYVKSHQAKNTRLLKYLWGLFTTRQTAKEMRVMGFDGYITDKWRNTRDGVNEELWAVEKRDALSLLTCDGIRIIGYGASVIVVLILTLRGQVSIGVFGAAIAAFLSMQNGMQSFLECLGRFPEQISYASDYFSFLDMPVESNGNIIYDGLQEKIEFKGVSFKYPNSEKYALNSIDLTIGKGEKIAILGENGSGKTTLSKLLLGLYKAENGQILYDDISLEDLEKNSFYRTVSAIAQDYVTYNLTLRENVAISNIDKLDDDSKILAALEDFDSDDFDNLDIMMGREFGGIELSGGQWQKLAIARGLFRDSEIILLDEPTSALDPLIETEILRRFIDATKDKTALIISHRVGLCKLVDKILVMKDGRIAEVGTHEDLMGMKGEYNKLYTAQEKWYK